MVCLYIVTSVIELTYFKLLGLTLCKTFRLGLGLRFRLSLMKSDLVVFMYLKNQTRQSPWWRKYRLKP